MFLLYNIVYLFAEFLLRCFGGVWWWRKGFWGTRASIGHDSEPASSKKDVKRDEAKILGDCGFLGWSSNTVMTGPTLLLNLDDANMCAVAAKATVLPHTTVMRGRVSTCSRVSSNSLLLASTTLHGETVQRRGCIHNDAYLHKTAGDDCKVFQCMIRSWKRRQNT